MEGIAGMTVMEVEEVRSQFILEVMLGCMTTGWRDLFREVERVVEGKVEAVWPHPIISRLSYILLSGDISEQCLVGAGFCVPCPVSDCAALIWPSLCHIHPHDPE